ncbi:MAG: DNA primase large subunit PriL [archaeon]|nr:DNA primase large subunit PriL [archaeon]
MDTLRAARFPFLPDASEYAEKNLESIDALLTHPIYEGARKRGLERIRSALSTTDRKIPDVTLAGGSRAEENRMNEILSYPYARILVSCINDRLLTQRYALTEAERMVSILETDSMAAQVIIDEFEVNAKDDHREYIEMHFADYLRYSYVMHAIDWKLINRDVKNGYVRMERSKFNRLLQNAYRLRIEQELPLNVPEGYIGMIRRDLEAVKMMLIELKDSLSPTGGQEMKNEFLPPCISGIIRMAQNGQNLPHSARFALVTFLHALGLNYQQIVAIFAVSPDFNEAMSEYQIKHITGELNGGEGYTPPTCATMKTNGICLNPDELCGKLKHPLGYYRIKAGIKGPSSKQPPTP